MIRDNSWVTASELSKREFNSLRGKVCSAIESLGLPHQQERAVIALVKQHTYDSQEVIAQLVEQSSNMKFKYESNRIVHE